MEGVGSESQEGLALAAADHVWDIGQTGTASHSSSDGTSAVSGQQKMPRMRWHQSPLQK